MVMEDMLPCASVMKIILFILMTITFQVNLKRVQLGLCSITKEVLPSINYKMPFWIQQGSFFSFTLTLFVSL